MFCNNVAFIVVFNCVSADVQCAHGQAKEKDVCVSLENCLK